MADMTSLDRFVGDAMSKSGALGLLSRRNASDDGPKARVETRS